MIRFNYYPGHIKKSKPLGTVSLFEFFDAIKKPNQKIIEILIKVRKAKRDGDEALKTELKSKLYSFTPCVLIEGRRRYEDIKQFTGLMALDFDKLDPDHVVSFKEFLFNNYKFIIATWLSASGCGVRALVKIPVVTSTDDFKALFFGLKYFEMEKYTGFDSAPNNAVLPLYISFDPEILIRENTLEMWTRTYSPPVVSNPVQYKFSDEHVRIQRIMKSAIDKIHDNGHPQLRGTAVALGGYVSAGYIKEDSAIEIIESLIDSNHYLTSKDARGIEGYKITARSGIKKGMEKKLFLRD